MKKLIMLSLILYAFASLSLRAQGRYTLFDEEFMVVKKEKKAFYFSRDYFQLKGEETLLLIPLDGSQKVTALFRDGEFASQTPYVGDAPDLSNPEGTAEHFADDIPPEEFDQPPAPKGGLPAFFTFIGENISYPKSAGRKGIQGRVFVAVVVTREGEVANVQAVKGIHPAIDAEAERVLKEFGEQIGWEPALYKGAPVTARLIIPVLFRL